MKTFIKSVFLLLFLSATAHAQARVEVLIDLPNACLRSAMQRNAAAFLSDINTSYVRKRELRFGRYLSNQTVRSAMIAEWAQERIRIPEAKLIETVLQY